MNEALRVGDIVKLKSGGPEMTVAQVFQNDQVRCIWFDAGECKESDFYVETLKKK